MRAATISSYGEIADVVEVTDVATPTCGPHDVLIFVRAAGVNPVDYLTVKGFMQADKRLLAPRVLGNEVSGMVAAVGPSVRSFAVGDEVISRVDPRAGGAFAEIVSVDESLVAFKPENISFEEAAGLPLVSLTAWQALTEQAHLLTGQRVLVHGGAGGVGSAAIQIAKYLGAEVVATASGDGVKVAAELGADHVVDYKKQNFVEVVSPVDIVLDTVGGETQTLSFSVLKPGGVLVSILAVPDAEVQEKRWGVSVKPFFMHPDGAQLSKISDLVEAGHLRPTLGRVFPLDSAKEALIAVQGGNARGKTVIRVGS